jgi:predicted transcriptional regulator
MKGIRIRPEKEGIRASLFDLEADIMEVVWSKGWETFAVADVHRELERDRDIAYTTVMTVVNRLHEKELLERERDGRRYVYRSRMTRDQFLREMTREVLESLSDVGREGATAYLVERVSEAGVEELARLEALIKARRRELKS